MNKSIILVALLVLWTPLAWAQSGFEDSDGKSSIVLKQGGTGKINLTDASIKISYLYQTTTNPVRIGFELSGKATNGITTLFDKDDIAPEAKAKLSLSYQWLLSTKPDAKEESCLVRDDWATVQFGYSRAQYKLFNTAHSLADQKEKKNFDGFSLTVYYNILFRYNLSIGVSLGLDHQNNYTDLKVVEIFDKTVIYDSAGFFRGTTKTEKMRQGAFHESNHTLGNYDIIWMPDFLRNRIGFDLFGRLDWNKSDNTFKPGIGIFIAEKGAPTQVIGGITFESIEGKLRIGLLAGFNF